MKIAQKLAAGGGRWRSDSLPKLEAQQNTALQEWNVCGTPCKLMFCGLRQGNYKRIRRNRPNKNHNN